MVKLWKKLFILNKEKSRKITISILTAGLCIIHDVCISQGRL